MKKYIALLAGIAFLAVPAICSAGLVIGDFEGGFDGWYTGAPNVISNSTIGVTLGTGSLQVTDPDGGWGGSIELPMLDQANAVDLVAAATQPGAKISADITLMNSDNSIPGWYLDIGLIVNAEGYWNTMSWVGGLAIPWDPATVTVEFSLDPAAQAAIANGAALETYANIGLITNGGTNTYYVDNIQIIPEPATIGLLGVAGIGLLAFRRRLKV